MEKRILYFLVVFFFLLTFVSAQSTQCTDSDVNSAFPDGKNYYVKGNTNGTNREGTDFCGVRTVPEFSEPVIVNSCEKMEWASGQKCTLYEFACNEYGHAVRWEYECPYGCEDGACILECTDTDGGKNHYVKGTVRGLTGVGQVDDNTDKCFVLGDQVPDADIGKLGEFYCCGVNGICLETYECANGCQDGACIQEPSEGVCTDSDGGINLFIKGTTIFENGEIKTDGCIRENLEGSWSDTGDIVTKSKFIVEYSCDENSPNSFKEDVFECLNGCQDGACIETIECDSDGDCQVAYGEGYICKNGACIQESSMTCIDTDGGINYYVKGIVKGMDAAIDEYVELTDKCEENILYEYVCAETAPGGKYFVITSVYEYECPNGCQDGVCIQPEGLEKALKINSPENGAIIDKPIEIIFTIKNTEDRILEFKDPFTDGNDGLQLIIEDMGRQWHLWSTGDIRDGELIELKLNPGESVTKTIEFDPNYDPFSPDPFKFSGDVRLILRHFILTDTYGLGSLGSDEISVNIPFTSNILIERDVGEFKYEASKVEGPFTEAFEGWTGKQHAASYIYKNIPIVAMILRLGSISQAEDYLNKMLEDARKTVSISLIEINGNEVYAYNNHTFWISGIDVVFVGDKTVLSTGAIGGDISLDLAQAYLERFPSDIGKEEIEPACGNGICEGGETNQNCPVDCSCQGCVLDNKCYPFGYRKKGEYCSDNYEFVGQIEAGSSCDNNFECKSNVCVNDECVSGNLIQRIIEWFKRLFGIG